MSKHEAQACTMPGCSEEATRWYEDPAYPEGTRYVCLNHEEIADVEEGVHDRITNSANEEAELAVYQCQEDCEVCA